MQFHDFFHNGQPNTVALGGVGFVRLKNFWKMRSRFSGGMVLPVFETATRMLSEPVWIVTRINPYSGANLTALSSRLIQTSFSSSGSASISYSSKPRLRSRCFAFQKQDAGADLLREIEPALRPENGLVFDPGEIQDIGSQGR